MTDVQSDAPSAYVQSPYSETYFTRGDLTLLRRVVRHYPEGCRNHTRAVSLLSRIEKLLRYDE